MIYGISWCGDVRCLPWHGCCRWLQLCFPQKRKNAKEDDLMLASGKAAANAVTAPKVANTKITQKPDGTRVNKSGLQGACLAHMGSSSASGASSPQTKRICKSTTWKQRNNNRLSTYHCLSPAPLTSFVRHARKFKAQPRAFVSTPLGKQTLELHLRRSVLLHKPT